jgi:zinc protease
VTRALRSALLAFSLGAAWTPGHAGSPAGGTTPTPPPIPAHPRDLEFPPSSWNPPSAATHRLALPAGAVAFLIEDATLPLVDIVVVARAGADRESAKLRGLSQWTASMLRRGGTESLPPDDFDQRADELGAILGSGATQLYGTATLRCTSSVLGDALDLLLDMIEHPRFDSERLAGARRNLAEGLTRRTLDPLAVLDREWGWLLFGADHFSTRPLRRQDLDNLSTEALAAFHHRYWRPENLVFAVAGDIDAETLHRLVDARLAAWQARLPAHSANAWPPAGPTATPRAGLFHLAAKIPQAKVALGLRAPSTLPSVEERIKIEVMAEILGGRGAISRLNGRLRSAQGLVYRIDADLDPGDLWPAGYRISFDTSAADTPRAVRAVIEEIERLRTTEPLPEELAVVKRELVARQLQEFDTAEEAVGFLVQDWLVGRPPSYRSRYRELVEAVTATDVRETARNHLQVDDLTVLVVGPWEEVRGQVGADGESELERILGRRVQRLPARDPSTLEALP